jgi:polar amino acid transport system ATP-binding protein
MNIDRSVPLVEITDLRKSFGSNEVLKGVSLSINRSEVVCIIGKSGSGKSTLLRCINGLEEFQSGQILVGNKLVQKKDTSALRALRQEVGMVFQSFNLFPAMTVGKNVMLAPKLVKHQSPFEVKTLAENLLKRVGLEDKFDSLPHQLSGGQQQRVAIARALAMNPSIILCDEITSALDPELVGEVLQVIEGLAKDGVTLIIVTHEMAFARKVCDRIVFMHQGLIHEIGTPAEIFSSPQTAELKTFLSIVHN